MPDQIGLKKGHAKLEKRGEAAKSTGGVRNEWKEYHLVHIHSIVQKSDEQIVALRLRLGEEGLHILAAQP